MTGFYHPEFLFALIAIPVLVYYYWYHEKHSRRRALEFSKLSFVKAAGKAQTSDGKHSKVSYFTPKKTVFILFLLAFIFLIIGLAGPHIPLETEKEGVNVVLAMDVSGSMQATDYKPNRLEVAKKSALLLVNSLGEKDYAGIVVFDSGASSAAYLSPDKEKTGRKLMAITKRDGNTAIGDGLALATDMADSIPGKRKVVILLSDGENNAGSITPAEAVTFAKERDIQVFTIGLGSDEPVLYDYDPFGNPLYANLDEGNLKFIAEETGGEYFRSVDEETLQEIYAGLNQEIVREAEETDVSRIFYYLGVIALLAGMLLAFGRRQVIP
ncbi:VWA domain-containing protein [Methanogenium marinum]|uniref:VWA domain-containing protein n=1 Tax=Methanogenium marinum TaxID=348610 RepID=A0A9Q4KR59_9EURY|nr:VWA domain-containing protein [Methanogenium marinum]MDE4908825.1 VWA domain-containing protein [Methanogenium marinum]